MKNSFDQSLDHAPVIALIDVDNPEQAFRAGTACWAGGFRLIAIAATLEAAPDIVSALGSRSDLLVGLWDVQTLDRLADFDLSCVAFAFGSPELATAACLASIPYVPTTNDIRGISGSKGAVCLSQVASLGGTQAITNLGVGQPTFDLFVQGGIGGDECAMYLDAGARGLLLTNALMSPSLLNDGDYRSIRNYAAAVHQKATHLSRNALENTA